MAEFLDTQGVSYYLKKLINNSNDKLYLISPYLQLNNQLKISLEDRHKFQIDIILIYGKVSDINPEDSTWLQSMPGMFNVSNVRNPGSIKLRDTLLISKLFSLTQNPAFYSVGFAA